MKKKILAAFMAVSMFTTITTVNMTQVQANGIYGNNISTTSAEPVISDANICENMINNLVKSIQDKDWKNYVELMSYEEREFYNSYFNDVSYTDGIKQIENISLASIEELALEQVEGELL